MALAAEQPQAQVGWSWLVAAQSIPSSEDYFAGELAFSSTDGEQGWDEEEVMPLICGWWCPSLTPGPSCPSRGPHRLGQ